MSPYLKSALRTCILSVTLCFVYNCSQAQYASTVKVNFVRTWDVKRPLSDVAQVLANTNVAEVQQSTTYFDGLGRIVQTVAKEASPDKADMVQMTEYDPHGRQRYHHLAFTSTVVNAGDPISNGKFKLNPILQNDYCYFKYIIEQTPYYDYLPNQGIGGLIGRTDFDNSPLNRPVNTMRSGGSWVTVNRGIQQAYEVNTANEVRTWTTDATGQNVPVSNGWYAAGQLFRNITTDEHGKRVVEYKDKEGKVILKKVEIKSNGASVITSHAEWLCTYYIYNVMGRLRWVIQPVGVERLSLPPLNWVFDNTTLATSSIAKEQCFFYDYDSRGRIVDKSVPGTGVSEMVYDARDRLVMYRTARHAVVGQEYWSVNKYDNYNRITQIYLYANTTTQASHQTSATADLNYPVMASSALMQENYYDNYAWWSNQFGTYYPMNTGNIFARNFILTHNAAPDYAQPQTPEYTNVIGLQTGHKLRVLGTGTYLNRINIYDEKGRLLQSSGANNSSGRETVTNQYDFTGKVIRSHLAHDKGTAPGRILRLTTQYVYDHAGRLLELRKGTNAGPIRSLALNTYDRLGKLSQKQLGGGLEIQRFEYDIHGWIIGMNRGYLRDAYINKFGYELAYENQQCITMGVYNNAQFNGNITGLIWKSAGDGIPRKLDFVYDAANRLVQAEFNEFTGNYNRNAGIDFSLNAVTYDANGNILTMQQSGWKPGGSSLIDNLTYSYFPNSNRLQAVADVAATANLKLGDFQNGITDPTEYDHDKNGNLLFDKNKGITSILYTHLNTPYEINFGTKGKITYQYDNLGNKLKKIVQDNTNGTTTTWLYMGSIVYKNEVLESFGHEEGRARPNPAQTAVEATDFFFDYFLKDHLGNTRMVITEEVDSDAYPALSFEGTSGTQQVNEQNAFWENRTGASINVTAVRVSRAGGNEMLVRKSTGAIGAAKLLKVMAGDKIHTSVDYFYNIVNSNNSLANGLNSLVANFASSLTASGQITGLLKDGAGAISTALSNTTALGTLLNTPNTTSGTNNAPKAYLNVVFFDDQFRFDATASVVIPVPYNVNAKATISRMGASAVLAKKSGYVYVYFSNESDELVYFDNFLLTHERGPILEETHYYPFGLTMAGLSSKAMGKLENRKLFNDGTEFSNKEFSDASGLDWYETTFRSYDSQLGKFHQIDPLSEEFFEWSPYTFAINNPILINDPMGLDTLTRQTNLAPVYVVAKISYYKVYLNRLRYAEKLGQSAPVVFDWDNNKVRRELNRIHLYETRKNEMDEAVGEGIIFIGGFLLPEGKIFEGIGWLYRLGKARQAAKALKIGSEIVQGGVQYSDDLVKAAQKLYPKKAGITELHHITPKYLGGAVDGPVVPLNGAYHQQITNAFRQAWPYGQAKPTAAQLQKIMDDVYSQYPLPPGY
jgi:RHS repeat-associated protein